MNVWIPSHLSLGVKEEDEEQCRRRVVIVVRSGSSWLKSGKELKVQFNGEREIEGRRKKFSTPLFRPN